jgi:translation initiation factor 1
MAKKQKNRVNMVYSTNPNFSFEDDQEEVAETLPNDRQKLYVSLDKKNRGGKEVTLVEGFIGSEEDLKDLGKILKTKCGVGGSAKEGEIIVQGNFRDKVMVELVKLRFKVVRKGG